MLTVFYKGKDKKSKIKKGIHGRFATQSEADKQESYARKYFRGRAEVWQEGQPEEAEDLDPDEEDDDEEDAVQEIEYSAATKGKSKA